MAIDLSSVNVNLDKINGDINSILSEIKPMFNSEQCHVNIPGNVVNSVDLDSACKIFGLKSDK